MIQENQFAIILQPSSGAYRLLDFLEYGNLRNPVFYSF